MSNENSVKHIPRASGLTSKRNPLLNFSSRTCISHHEFGNFEIYCVQIIGKGICKLKYRKKTLPIVPPQITYPSPYFFLMTSCFKIAMFLLLLQLQKRQFLRLLAGNWFAKVRSKGDKE